MVGLLLSFARDFDPQVGAIEAQFLSLLQIPDISLVPNWEVNFGQEKTFAQTALFYFETLAAAMERDDFGKDEMLRLGWAEVMNKNRIVLKVIDPLKKRYNEVWFEDEIAYIHTTPEYWGMYVEDIGFAQKLADLL
ncbi:hypothetical protein EUX98_g9749 [Antrodiella citrinella]|uniref:Uncharacterized protein n=1 Tax=Antrodiella citrinella TaxID=2447956 RepID=A0A4S4LM34_9APHY|nr:hypothetical protein EUX98_g9749 [Antrodiella citrinella]